MINKIKKQNKGQIAIIVLLASAILLTIGLSVSKKTVTDTKIGTDEESLKEAFNTAESAINNYLNDGSTTYTTEGSGASVVSTNIGNASSLSSEGQILANSNQLFWLVNHNDNGSVGSTYYGSGSVNLSVDSAFKGALKVDYFYIDSSSKYQVQHLGCRYDGGNNSDFDNGFDDSCSTLTLTGSPLLISITPIDSATNLTLVGTANFPYQGEEITSVGTVESGVKTQIKTRNIYQIPTFFLEAITAKNIIQ